MLYIQSLLQNIAAAHENIRARVPSKARFGIIALLAFISFIILIFQADWLMAHMIALLPLFYIAAVLAVGLKRALYGTAVFIFFCFALWLRVGPPHEAVLGGSYVNFAENDGWYNMRLVENLVHHFPGRNSFDPYTLYPHGEAIPFAPLFDWFLALIIWVAGLGHPSAALIEKIGAYFPAVLGASTILPVYFIGKELFNRNAGLICAGLLAIAGGEFLFRSILGFTDHHAAETLLITTTMLFIILALKRAKDNLPTLSHIKNKDWSILKKPLLFALLAGFTLGLYLLCWVGSIMFVFIIFMYFVVQFIVDHLHDKSTDYLMIIGVPIFLTALIMSAAFSNWLVQRDLNIAALVISVAAICLFTFLSLLMARKNLRRIYYPFALALIGLAGAGIFYAIDPSLLRNMYNQFAIFSPSTTTLTIMEAQPLFSDFHISTMTQHRIWTYFTTGLIIAPIAFIEMIYYAMKGNKGTKLMFSGCVILVLLTIIIDQFASLPRQLYIAEFIAVISLYSYFEKNASRILLLIWSAVVLLALLGQTRYAYYLAINVVLLSGYLLWRLPGWITQLLALIHWKEADTADKAKTRADKRRAKVHKEQPTFSFLRPRHVAGALSVVAVFFLAIYPNLIYGTYTQTGWSPANSATLYLPYHPYGPNSDWYEALTWMKENTPDPFGDPDFYYALYQQPEDGQNYNYPDSAYGVMSWWDYGHWITRIARRIPNANPFQSGIGGTAANGSIIPGASTFMTAQNESSASEVMDALGSRYVVIDYETAWPKYHTMVVWSGKNESAFYENWYRTSDGKLVCYENPDTNLTPEVTIFYPAYYQSMCARLYNFGTAAVVPNNSTWVISYTWQTSENGERYKELTDVANNQAPFATYEEAAAFINDHPGYVIAGTNPFVCPIPLEALKEYTLIHSSSSSVVQVENRNLYYVEIFEYTGYKQ